MRGATGLDAEGLLHQPCCICKDCLSYLYISLSNTEEKRCKKEVERHKKRLSQVHPCPHWYDMMRKVSCRQRMP